MRPTIQEKTEIIKDAILCKQPERVPIVCSAGPSYAIEYAGYDLKTALWDIDLMAKSYDKLYSEVYFDATGSLPRFPLVYKINSSRAFVPRDPDHLVQHPEIEGLLREEYDDYIKDPFKCIVETVIPRLYPALGKRGMEGKLNMLRAMIADKQTKEEYKEKVGGIEKKHGIVNIRKCTIAAPFDFVADLLRGFTAICVDIRRYRDRLLAATEATLPLMYRLAKILDPNPDVTKSIFIPLHMPSYMRTKDVEELYWPTFKKLVCRLVKEGHTLQIFFEKNWSRFYHLIQELPTGIIAYFEEDDLGEVKKKIGDKICIMGNFPISMLRLNTKEECIDKAKEILDKAAPGGGYMFSLDKSLLGITDAKPENLIGVSEFVREYGVYT